MIEDLKVTMGWTPSGTGRSLLDFFNYSGITTFTNDSQYRRNYQFTANADGYNTTWGSITELLIWNTVVSEIDAGRPLAYIIATGGKMTFIGDYSIDEWSFPTSGHAMTAVGYESWDIGLGTDLHIVKVYWNYLVPKVGGQKRPLEIINNTSEHKVVIKIRPGKGTESADLETVLISGPTTARPGESISVRRVIADNGSANAGAFTIKYYLSTNATISSGDQLIGSEDVTSLTAGSRSDISVSLTIPATMSTGSYFLGMMVDTNNSVTESNENNNTAASSGQIAISDQGDQYEPDNTKAQAKQIATSGAAQSHTIHVNNDEDYVYFDAELGYQYTVVTAGGLDTVLKIYRGDTLLGEYDNDNGDDNNESEIISVSSSNRISVGVIERGQNSTGSYTISVTRSGTGSGTTFNIGDKVRVKAGVTPKFGWGDVQSGDIGTVVSFDTSELVAWGYDASNAMKVDFPRQSGWWAYIPEMELVQSSGTSTTANWYTVNRAISSPHPYTNNYNNTWTITHTGAQKIRVHFSSFSTESGYDYVYILDANNAVSARYDGSKGAFWSAEVPGSVVKIRLITDGSNTRQGFDIDQYSYYGTASKPVLGEELTTLESIPTATELSQNYPNPFNAETMIPFSIGSRDAGKQARLVIYSILGQEVATIINESLQAGNYVLIWDGMDSRKCKVASGSYFYILNVDRTLKIQKMLIVK